MDWLTNRLIKNDWFECHLRFISFLGTSTHPSIHPFSQPSTFLICPLLVSTIHLTSQLVSQSILRGATDWSGGLLKLPLSLVWSLEHTLFTPSFNPSIYLISHPLFIMYSVLFNNLPDQSVAPLKMDWFTN
jgi:hypothetical protein